MYLSNLSYQACQPVLHANPGNLAGCKSALLTSNSNACPWYYNTSSAVRAKTRFLGPEGQKGLGFVFQRRKIDRQTAVQAATNCTSKKNSARPKCIETVQKKIASVASAV